MDEELQSRNIFLDTHVFTAETFFLGTTKLEALRKLAAGGQIRLLMSAVTVAECKTRIRKMIAEAEEVLIKNERKLAILRNANSLNSSWLVKLDKDTAAREITEKFEEFVNKAKIIVCPYVSTERLF